jgi:hypothetical protein
MLRTKTLRLPAFVGFAFSGMLLVITSVHPYGARHFAPLPGALMNLTTGMDVNYDTWLSASEACLSSQQSQGYVIDCTGESDGTPCAYCSGVTSSRFTVIPNVDGEDGADASGGKLSCTSPANKAAYGSCSGGSCNATKTNSTCAGSNIPAYVGET